MRSNLLHSAIKVCMRIYLMKKSGIYSLAQCLFLSFGQGCQLGDGSFSFSKQHRMRNAAAKVSTAAVRLLTSEQKKLPAIMGLNQS